MIKLIKYMKKLTITGYNKESSTSYNKVKVLDDKNSTNLIDSIFIPIANVK